MKYASISDRDDANNTYVIILLVDIFQI